MSEKKSYLVHLIYAGAFLLAVLAVLAFLLYQNHEVAQQTKEKAAQEAIRKEQENKKLEDCLNAAGETYALDWALACTKQKNDSETMLKNCLKEAKTNAIFFYPDDLTYQKNFYSLKEAECYKTVSDIEGNPSCTLFFGRGHELNNELMALKEECMKKASIGN